MHDDERLGELARQHRIMLAIRLLGVPFALVQVLTYYIPYPPGVRAMALSFVALLAVGTPVVWFGSRRSTSVSGARRWALAGLLLDTVVAVGLVVSYTFDPETAVWVVLYLIPLEGAVFFQLGGALWAFALIAAAYTSREVYGAIRYDVPLLAVSISFRMGVGLMMAIVMGVSARGLTRERDRLRILTDALRRRGEDLAAANVALQAARRAQIEFVAVTNHELRTPLTAIKGFALTLSQRWEDMDDEVKRAAVDAIDQQSRRLEELVADLLTVSSMRVGGLAIVPRPLMLSRWLHEAVTVAEVPAVIDCPDDVLVQADSTRLLQILVNLLSNARKYGAPPIHLTGATDGERTTIEVRDHGPGVPPSFEPRMYEEFTQASVGVNRTADGHGLGLAIVCYLVDALSGHITYRTGEEGGAVFTVDLPAGVGTGHESAPSDARSIASLPVEPPPPAAG